MVYMNASSARVARHLVHPTGGIKTSTSVLPLSCRPIDGLLTPECVLLFLPDNAKAKFSHPVMR